MTFENVMVCKPQLDTFMSNGPQEVMLQIPVCMAAQLKTKKSEIHEETTVGPPKPVFLTGETAIE